MTAIHDKIDPAWSGPRQGDGVFTTMRVRDGAAFDWAAHLRRLEAHGRAYGLGPLPEETAIARAAAAALLAVGLTTGEAVVRPALWRTGPKTPAAFVLEAFPAKAASQEPIRLVLAATPSVMDVKAAAYGERFRARAEACETEDDRAAGDLCDALFLDAHGRAASATTANIFALIDGALLTPPVGPGVLAGTARAWMMETAARYGVPAGVAPLDVDALARAEGLILTNATMGPRPAFLEGAPAAIDPRDTAARWRAAWAARLPEKRLLP